MDNEDKKIEIIDAEYTVVFNGFFDLSNMGFELKDKIETAFNSQSKNALEAKMLPNHSVQFSKKDTRLRVIFGEGSISISYQKKTPSDNIDYFLFRDFALDILRFINENYDLAFTKMSFSKKI